MRRNLRLLPWWWVLRWPAFGEALWVIYLIEERGFSLGQVFVLHAAFVTIALLAEVPTGAFADRYGRRPALLLSTALISVGFLAFGIGETFALLTLAWTALAVADAFMSGADNALLYDTMDALGRRDDFPRARGRLGAIQNAALAVIVIVGAGVAAATTLSVPFLLAGLATLPAVALTWMLTEPPRAAPIEARRSFLDTALVAVRHAVRVRSIATIILVLAVLTIAFELMGSRSNRSPVPTSSHSGRSAGSAASRC